EPLFSFLSTPHHRCLGEVRCDGFGEWVRMKLRYNIELPVPDWFDPTRDADALAAMMRAAAERYIEAGPSPTGEWEPLGPVGVEALGSGGPGRGGDRGGAE